MDEIKENSTLRILHGTIEIANQMYTLTEGLKKLGTNAKTLNYYPSYLGYKSDYIFNIGSFKNINEANMETKKLALKMITENDIFHFHFSTSLTLDYWDLHILKDLNKKIIMHHWGSDVRMVSTAKKINPYVRVKILDEDIIKRRLDFLSKFVDYCVVADQELYSYVKDFYKNVVLIPQAIETDKYRSTDSDVEENQKFLIVHAPTNREIKGTTFIMNAIENLKHKYDFEFRLVENVSHEEAKKIYEKSDLIIDQVLSAGHGLFALECMAMGKPVICSISDFMKDYYPKELPIISAGPYEIESKLEFILNNKDMLQSIGNKGREYVLKYHDYLVVSKMTLELYKGSDSIDI